MAPTKKHTHTHAQYYSFLVLLGENVLVVYSNKRLKVSQFIMSCINSLSCISYIVFSHISEKNFLLNASIHSWKQREKDAQISDFKTSNKTESLPPVYPNIIEDILLLLSASYKILICLFCISISFSLSIWNFYNLWRYLRNLVVQLVE